VPPTRLKNEDQLVLRAIERPHAAIGLGPNTQILELAVGALGRGQHLADVTPVHADVMDGAVGGMRGKIAEDRLEEARELGFGHFACGHGELAVLHRAEAADMAVDRNIVGGIGEYHLRTLISKQTGINGGIRRIAADQPVFTDQPEIARACDGRARVVDLWDLVRRVALIRVRPSCLQLAEQDVDLRHLEAGDGDVEVEIELKQVLQLDREQLAIPAGVLG
jgi:hypothetical protein